MGPSGTRVLRGRETILGGPGDPRAPKGGRLQKLRNKCSLALPRVLATDSILVSDEEPGKGSLELLDCVSSCLLGSYRQYLGWGDSQDTLSS